MIRVVVAEDQGMVLGALAALLETETDIEVVALAHDGREALALVRDHEPDVLLTDIEMPHLTGLDVANEIKRLELSTRVVILTTFARAGYLRRALEAGASGYLLKDSPPDMLANAVRRVHAGLRAVDPTLAAEAWTSADPLTDRERQALRFAGEGKSGDCGGAESVGGNGAQLRVGRDVETRRFDAGGGCAHRAGEGVVVGDSVGS